MPHSCRPTCQALLFIVAVLLAANNAVATISSSHGGSSNDQERNEQKTTNRRKTFESRIIGGTKASPGEYPYFVEWSGCGASLIHEDIILSAGHCNQQRTNQVLVGAYNAESTSQGAQWRNIVTRRLHPQFNKNSLAYDYLVMKLDNSVDFTPVSLNFDANYPSVNQLLTVIGFGVTSTPGGSEPSTLREVNVNYVNPTTCNNAYGGSIIRNLMICAGVSGGGKDSCQGDSGGPLLDSNNVQVGIVSFGYGCAEPGYPGVYSRVSGGADWIQQQICDLSSNPPDSCSGNSSPVSPPTPPPVRPTRAPVPPTPAPVPPTPAPIIPPTPQPISPTSEPVTSSPTQNVISVEPGTTIVRVDIVYDFYADETSWTIVNATGQVAANSSAGEPNQLTSTYLHLTPGSYVLQLSDLYGDGYCCQYGTGSYKVYALVNGKYQSLTYGFGRFGTQLNVSFKVPSTSPTLPPPPPTVRPTPSPPPPTPVGSDCRDSTSSFDYSVTVGGIFSQGRKTCSWLAFHPDFILALCQSGQQANTLCPKTCGVCTNPCQGQDNTTATFSINGVIRNCVWLSIRPSLWLKQCSPGRAAYTYCKDICDSC